MCVDALNRSSRFEGTRGCAFFSPLRFYIQFGAASLSTPSNPSTLADIRMFLLLSCRHVDEIWSDISTVAFGRCANITLMEQMKFLHGLVILGKGFSGSQHPKHASA
jgi:hypothetical protein